METRMGKINRHPAATKGVSAGDTAIGEYGIMPNTAKEFANRARLAGEALPEDIAILKGDNKNVEDILKSNKDLMDLYVDRISEHVLGKSERPENLVDRPDLELEDAYMRWLYGHNTPQDKIEDIKSRDTKTVNRIRKALDEINSQVPSIEETVLKPLEDLKKPIEQKPVKLNNKG